MRDVIVVGAGPAGSSVAAELAERDLDVALYEKRQEIGVPKRCGEGISTRSLEKVGFDIPGKCKSQIINGALVHSPDGNFVKISSDERMGWILERELFDKWMAERAAEAGAKVRAKAKVKGLLPENKGAKVEIEGEEIEEEAKMVIAADGVESKISREAGVKDPSDLQLVDSGYQYEMVNLDLKDKNKLELYFGKDIAPRGYIWVFPKDERSANVGIGIGGDVKGSAKHYLERFVEKNERFINASIVEVNSGMVPVGGFLNDMTSENFLAVGDAANQVNPIHGGGIWEGIRSGMIASEVAHKAIKEGDTSHKNLHEYNKKWWKIRGKDLKKVEKLREVLEDLDDEDLNYLAEKLEGEDLVEFVSGNRLSKLGRILLNRPKMIKSARKLI